MPIQKTATTPTGATPSYHRVKGLRMDFELNQAHVHLVSYMDEFAFLTDRPLVWNWDIAIPALSVAGSMADIEKALVETASSPVYGGTVLSESGLDLERGKQRKLAEINEKCSQQITYGFISDALGSPHGYPAKPQDQSNLVASVTASMVPGLPDGWVTPFWCVDGEGVWAFREHTASQIQQVGQHGKAAIVASMTKNAALAAQVAQVQSVGDLTNITW